jgi:hypothetical protein
MSYEFLDRGPQVLDELAGFLGLDTDDLEECIGDDWSVSSEDGSRTFLRTVKDEFDVAIQLGSSRQIFVGQAKGHWDGPGSLVYGIGSKPELVSTREDLLTNLTEAVNRASLARRATFRVCKYCKEYLPPENMESKTVCHGCATEHLGFIY